MKNTNVLLIFLILAVIFAALWTGTSSQSTSSDDSVGYYSQPASQVYVNESSGGGGAYPIPIPIPIPHPQPQPQPHQHNLGPGGQHQPQPHQHNLGPGGQHQPIHTHFITKPIHANVIHK